MEKLKRTLTRIDNKGYKAYKDLEGKTYTFPDFELCFYYVQGDPFAGPSQAAVRVEQKRAQFPPATYEPKIRKIALGDYLTRELSKQIKRVCKGRRGTGKSGLLAVDSPGQEILERSSVTVNKEYVEARFFIGLPARGRKVLGKQAEEMLFTELPELIKRTLFFSALDRNPLINHIKTAENQESMRNELREKGLVAFVANDAILPRRSGVDQRPLPRDQAVTFTSPPSLEVELSPPHGEKILGMGIPGGITLIVGGGYHGKSTLLRALERGVYNHIPGDGREYIVTVEDAVKIRAEDGRRVCKVNISPFIDNLPMKVDTTTFFSEDASGSTSQAANIIEALEIGTSLLLLDEDTSATNFMIRDERMQRLVEKNKEPITPFLDKVRDIYRDLGISTVIVMGGSGDYFDASDTVIMMDHYYAYDVTGDAKRVAEDYPRNRASEGGEGFGELTPRIVGKKGLDPVKGKKKKISAKGLYNIQYGAQNLSLFYLEQLVDAAQTRAIGDIINYVAEQYINESITLKKAIDLAFHDIYEKGLDVISPFYGEHPGDYSLPRPQEVAGAFNRLRSLHIK